MTNIVHMYAHEARLIRAINLTALAHDLAQAGNLNALRSVSAELTDLLDERTKNEDCYCKPNERQ